jgi:hypothetical protein
VNKYYSKTVVKKSNCEGSCKTHVKNDKVDWKYFTYCQTAINEDVSRGFTVIEVEL